MERKIYVETPPGEKFLTQYTRRLLLDCLKGIKQLESNEYVTVEDLWKTDKQNETKHTIRLIFSIIHDDGSFPETSAEKYKDFWKWDCHNVPKHHITPVTNYNTITVLEQRMHKMETMLLEHHLELESGWNAQTFLDVGMDMESSNDL